MKSRKGSNRTLSGKPKTLAGLDVAADVSEFVRYFAALELLCKHRVIAFEGPPVGGYKRNVADIDVADQESFAVSSATQAEPSGTNIRFARKPRPGAQ